jgi:hypothetical protein
MNLAAIQIQSAYRGHRARREIMATNQNTEIDTPSVDLVENKEEEFENEHIEGEVEKIELEESNEEDKTKEIDDNVQTDGEEACTYNTDVIDSESVEKISVDNGVLEEVLEGRTDDEINCTEENLEAQTEEFVESLIEQDFTDPVDPIDEINEQDGDNIPQSNMINSDNTVDFVLEATEVLSTGAIEGAQLDQENCEASDKEAESLEDNGFEEEFEKTGSPEMNEYVEKADIEIENDLLTEEDSQQIDYSNIEMPEDKLELEKMQDDPSGLESHCDDEISENAPLTENPEPSVDLQEENIYPPDMGETIPTDERAVVTEDNEWSDSNHSPFVDIISSPQLNEDDDLNQPLSSDVMACQENNSETEEVHNYDASANMLRSDEEENDTTITEAETNSEISKSILEWIEQEDAAPQQEENSAESAPCVLGEIETVSNLSDHLADLTENTTNLDDETTIGLLENNMITPSDNEDHLKDTNEQNVESGDSHDDTDLKEIENNVAVDQDDNALFEEVDQDASNDDEEEIWSKLQKDIELEEEQQHLAAIKIQSSFRGYKTRKDLNLASDQKEIVKSNDDTSEPTDNNPEGNISMEGNQFSALESTSEKSLEDNDHDDGLSEALAGVTETIASVALFMTDTPQPNSTIPFSENTPEGEINEVQNNDNDEEIAQALLANVNEVNDVTEESMPNGEEINNIQLIDSYVIISSIPDIPNSPTIPDTSNIEDNQESETNSDEEKNSSATTIVDNTVNEIVTSDPEVVFELYVESNETTNDGLLESSWQPKENSPQSLNYNYLEQDEIPKIKRNFEEEQENAAATKIQAGYRGYQDRKRLKIMQNQFDENQVTNNEEDEHLNDEIENAAATKIQAGYRGQQDRKRVKHLKDKITATGMLESDEVQFDEATKLFGSHEIIQHNPHNLTLIELENAAATKIQASYRGHQDRKRTKQFKDKKTNPDAVGIDEPRLFEKEIVQNDSDEYIEETQNLLATEQENFAATKIQSSYRGHQDRKRVKNLKDQLRYDSIQPNSAVITETLQFDETTNLNDSYKDIHSNQVNFTSIEVENAAATKIQAGYRGHQDRKRVRELKDHITNPDIVDIDKTQLVKTTDLNSSDDFVLQTQPYMTSIEVENAAATKIQAGYRGHQDRKRVQHLKNQISENQMLDNSENPYDNETIPFISEDYVLKSTQPEVSLLFEEENAAATKIQANFRGHQDRKRVQLLKVNNQIAENQVFDNNEENQSDEESIPFISDEYVLKSNQPKVTSFEQENAAATKIQASYRGHQDRKRVQHLKDQITENQALDKEENQSDDESIPFISDDYVLKSTQPEVTSFEEENAAATKIQASYRGHQDRKRVQHLKGQIAENEVLDKKENQSVESIQLISDDIALKPTQPETISFEQENDAATKIQASYRGHQDRKRVRHIKDQKAENQVLDHDKKHYDEGSISFISDDCVLKPIQPEVITLFELENAAATKIQAGYRGHQDRKRVQHLKGQVAENIVIENEENQHVQGTLQINSDEYALKHSQPEVSSVELENAAATKIQASYRGHQDRKRVKHFKAELTYAKKADEIELDNTSAEKTIVYECDDLIRNAAARSNVTSAELENAAATKIQSGFRGHQDRKRVQHLRENNSASK